MGIWTWLKRGTMQGWKNIKSIRALFPNFYQEIRIYIAWLSLKPARICCPSLDMTTWCLKNQSKSILDVGCLLYNTIYLSGSKTAAFSFGYSQTAFYLFFPLVSSHMNSFCPSASQNVRCSWPPGRTFQMTTRHSSKSKTST